MKFRNFLLFLIGLPIVALGQSFNTIKLYQPEFHDASLMKTQKISEVLLTEQIVKNKAKFEQLKSLDDIEGGQLMKLKKGEKITLSSKNGETYYWGYDSNGNIVFYGNQKSSFDGSWRETTTTKSIGTYQSYDKDGLVKSIKKYACHYSEPNCEKPQLFSENLISYEDKLLSKVEVKSYNPKGQLLREMNIGFEHKDGHPYKQIALPTSDHSQEDGVIEYQFDKDAKKLILEDNYTKQIWVFDAQGRIIKFNSENNIDGNLSTGTNTIIYNKKGQRVSSTELIFDNTEEIIFENKPTKEAEETKSHTIYLYSESGLLVREMTTSNHPNEEEFTVKTYHYYSRE